MSLDEEWLVEPTRRSRLRWTLVALLAVAVVFYGGVQVQQRWGTAAAAASPFAPAGPPSGMPAAASTSSGAVAATPQVVGTVTAVAGRTWTVTDFGGTAHEVTVPKGLKTAVGTTVSVAGSAITIRTTTQENP